MKAQRKTRPMSLQEVYYPNPELLNEGGVVDHIVKIFGWFTDMLGITADQGSKITNGIAAVEKASGVSPLYGEVPWHDFEGREFMGTRWGDINYIGELKTLADNKTATGRLLRLTGAFAGQDMTYDQVMDVYDSMPGWTFLNDLTVLQAGLLYKGVLTTTDPKIAFVTVQKLMPDLDGKTIRNAIQKINKDRKMSVLALRAMAAIASYAGTESYASAVKTADDLLSGGEGSLNFEEHVDRMRLGVNTPVKAVAMILKAMTVV